MNGSVGGGAHVNPKEGHKAGYQINTGDFQDSSTLLNPARLATNARQSAGHAYIIPESSWVPPFVINGAEGCYWWRHIRP